MLTIRRPELVNFSEEVPREVVCNFGDVWSRKKVLTWYGKGRAVY